MRRASAILIVTPFLVLIFAGTYSGCGSSSSTTGKAGNGGAGTGGAGTGSAGTGSAGTGSAGTGSAGTGSAGTGSAGTGSAGTGAAGTGAAGTGAAGTGAAGTGAAGTGTDGGAGTGTDGATDKGNPEAGNPDAQGAKSALATIAPFDVGTIKGTAAFKQVGNGVQLKVDLTDCPAGVHPLHIHAGTGCATMTEQGAHWDVPRGEMIGTGEITCAADMTGTLTYTRMDDVANLKWTIGDGTATDIVGHPIVIHGVGTGTTVRSGCGVIKLQ